MRKPAGLTGREAASFPGLSSVSSADSLALNATAASGTHACIVAQCGHSVHATQSEKVELPVLSKIPGVHLDRGALENKT